MFCWVQPQGEKRGFEEIAISLGQKHHQYHQKEKKEPFEMLQLFIQ